ncbi:unnamed protein product [Rotaria sp. Silwood2]|nr:unnamed protein product [Rotaria sp. Silwood2]CAF3301499.1 unnamed protein product [Rotaria sp. Silwood2]CAF4280952.1 unnamed protein product [Rotaria sp. Silwood2]
MNPIEHVLLILHCLKHFELHAGKQAIDLADGQRWENITGSLVTFNFNFHMALTDVETILDSFRTLFWLEKSWFVAYENDRLFSVPRFANTHCNGNFQRPIHSTVLDDKIFLDNITTLGLSHPLVDMKHYFSHVRILKINDIIKLESLSSIIDVDQVKHLMLSFPIIQPLPNATHLLNMHSLRELSIMTNLFQLIEQLKGMQFENIRTLDMISTLIFDDRYPVEQLCSIFPFVERLHVKSIHKATMIRMISGFTHLSNASFCLNSLSKTDQTDWQVKSERALYGARRLTNFCYTCRYNNSYLHVWIGEQVSQL